MRWIGPAIMSWRLSSCLFRLARTPFPTAPTTLTSLSPLSFLSSSRGFAKANLRWANVILLEDHEKLGQKHTLAVVRPGYARNTLVPQGLAVYATIDNKIKFNLLASDQQQEEDEESSEVMVSQEEKEVNDYVALYVRRLTELELTFYRAQVPKGIHSAVTGTDIVRYLQKQLFPGLRPEQLRFPNNTTEIAQLGSYSVELSLSSNSLLPGVGLYREFEARNLPPIPLKVHVLPPGAARAAGHRSQKKQQVGDEEY